MSGDDTVIVGPLTYRVEEPDQVEITLTLPLPAASQFVLPLELRATEDGMDVYCDGRKLPIPYAMFRPHPYRRVSATERGAQPGVDSEPSAPEGTVPMPHPVISGPQPKYLTAKRRRTHQ